MPKCQKRPKINLKSPTKKEKKPSTTSTPQVFDVAEAADASGRDEHIHACLALHPLVGAKGINGNTRCKKGLSLRSCGYVWVYNVCGTVRHPDQNLSNPPLCTHLLTHSPVTQASMYKLTSARSSPLDTIASRQPRPQHRRHRMYQTHPPPPPQRLCASEHHPCDQ